MLTITATTKKGTYETLEEKQKLKAQLLAIFEDTEDELVVINGFAVDGYETNTTCPFCQIIKDFDNDTIEVCDSCVGRGY